MARAGAVKAAVLADERLTAERVIIDTSRTTVMVTENGWIPMKLELDAQAIVN